jgi:3-dehydroquinate dehydratase/shikimate dehydrogenase
MICITIAQESRRLALADMLNAAQMGADLLEVRLDGFDKDPNPAELLAARRKPVLFSCRRRRDGGNWKGTEDERLMLLRQAVIAGADYIELEPDVASQVRRYGKTQRVIAFTELAETPADIAERYEECRHLDPDIIKLTCKARTPEEAWPLVQLLAKPPVPTVVVGLGRPGLMLAILGRRIGAPWTVAALERGMEAYPGQPTMNDLERVFHYRSIDKGTRFVGVTGLGEREYLTIAMLNAAFAHLGLALRCLPLQVGKVPVFKKVIDAVKLAGVVIEEDQQDALRPLATQTDADVQPAVLNPGGMPVERSVDLLVKQGEQWLGCHTFAAGAIAALDHAMQTNSSGPKPLPGATVVLYGTNTTARSIARALKEAGARIIFASQDRDALNRFCRMFGGRQIQREAIYSTLHDVLVVCGDGADVTKDDEEESELGPVRPNYLRASMTVMDLTQLPRRTHLLREAKARGCATVEPVALLLGQVQAEVKRLTGHDVPRNVLEKSLADLLPDDEPG